MIASATLRWLLLAIVAAAPLAALPVTFGPVQASIPEMLISLAVLVALPAVLKGKSRVARAPLSRGEAWAVSLFLLAALVSMTVTEYPRQSLRELRLLIVEPVALYLLLRVAPIDARWMRLAVSALILVVTGLALFGIGLVVSGRALVEAEGVQRALGVYPSPNHFALILGRMLPFALALGLAASPARAGYVLAAATILVALTLTFSGGGWLGGGAAVVAVIWLLAGWRRALILVGIGLLTGVLALGVLRVERISSRADLSRGTGFIRLQLWDASLAMLRDHPILGVGLDNFLYRYQQEYLSPEAAAEPNLSHPHNWVLNTWLSLGLLGLLSVLWLLAGFVMTLRAVLLAGPAPPVRALAVGAAGSMADFLIHGSVDNSYFLPDMALLFWFTLALARVLQEWKHGPE